MSEEMLDEEEIRKEVLQLFRIRDRTESVEEIERKAQELGYKSIRASIHTRTADNEKCYMFKKIRFRTDEDAYIIIYANHNQRTGKTLMLSWLLFPDEAYNIYPYATRIPDKLTELQLNVKFAEFSSFKELYEELEKLVGD
jgi:hypothetical protein